MDRVTFQAFFAGAVTTEPAPVANNTPDGLREAVNGQLKAAARGPEILQTVLVDSNAKTLSYEFIETVDHSENRFQYSYEVRDGMLYEETTYGNEVKKGFKAALLLPLATLIRKIIVPIIMGLPFVHPFLSEKMQRRVDFELKNYLVDRAICGLVGHLFLGILFLLGGFLAAKQINFWQSDLERWVNGHDSNDVATMTRRERLKETPYLMPCRQPVARFEAPASGEPINIRGAALPAKHKKAIAEDILAGRACLSYKPFLQVNGQDAPPPVRELFFPKPGIAVDLGCK